MSQLTRLVRKAIWSNAHFNFWQRFGVHVTRSHYYSPIPDTRELAKNEGLWQKKSDLVGLSFSPEKQLACLEEVFSKYKGESDFRVDRSNIPYEYYFNNAEFGLEDGLAFYSMIRHFKPSTIVEIGSGNSTMIGARACLKNQEDGRESRLISVEPYPRKFLVEGFPGLAGQVKSKVEELDVAFFDQLGENDILFIDSSHVLRTGNDVTYLYLNILPRLREGVIVHVHDIFLPYEYPRQWVVGNRVFWTEQYLLQAFLTHNPLYEVLFGNVFMNKNYPDRMREVFSHPEGYRQRNIPNSFWMRRKSGVG
jgi:hypothetical protein